VCVCVEPQGPQPKRVNIIHNTATLDTNKMIFAKTIGRSLFRTRPYLRKYSSICTYICTYIHTIEGKEAVRNIGTCPTPAVVEVNRLKLGRSYRHHPLCPISRSGCSTYICIYVCMYLMCSQLA
jgi:hypothetical protein